MHVRVYVCVCACLDDVAERGRHFHEPVLVDLDAAQHALGEQLRGGLGGRARGLGSGLGWQRVQGGEGEPDLARSVSDGFHLHAGRQADVHGLEGAVSGSKAQRQGTSQRRPGYATLGQGRAGCAT